MFPGEGKVKMSVEEQMDRMRRHQSGSMKEKRRSLQLPASPAPDPATRPAYKVVKSSQPPAGVARHLPTRPTPSPCPAWTGAVRVGREGLGRTHSGHLGEPAKASPHEAEGTMPQAFLVCI